MPGDTYDVMVWSGAELLLIIVCGNVPPMKPLYDHMFGSKKGTRWGNTPLRPEYKGSAKPSTFASSMASNSASQTSEGELVPKKGAILATTDIDVKMV